MNVTPTDNDFWRGIGGHFDTFGQIICEFIDNSISNFEKYQMATRSVVITIDIVDDCIIGPPDTRKRYKKSEQASRFLKIKIEDTGTGMTDISNMFRVGDQSNKHSILNEHGFGLKHALAAANSQNDNWSVSTRTKEDLENNEYSVIKAPYKFKNLEDKKVNLSNEKWGGEFNSTGTLIEFVCTQLMFSTVNKGKRGAPNLFLQMDYLCEDLGFIYAGIIKKGKATLTIKSNTISGEHNDVFNRGVEAIEPIWAGSYEPGEGSANEDLGGGIVQIQYKFGDVKESSHHKYYKRNMATSGVEVRINGRLLTSNLFYEIWQLEEHPSFNKFLAIINLVSTSSKALPTTKTAKNGIKTGDEKFEKLIEWIKKVHSKPEKKASDAITEIELVEKLANRKRTYIPAPNKSVETQLKVYKVGTECPVSIDLYVYDGYDVNIYEAKKDNADLQSLYQLLMYWDGAVDDELKPTKGILLASTFSKGVKEVMKRLNQRKDEKGEWYNFVTKTWKEEGIDYPN